MVITTDSQVKNLLSGNNNVTIVHVCVPQWLNGVLILLPSIEDTFEEIKGKTQDYLNLLELGVVLEEISDACPCEYQSEHTVALVCELCVCVTVCMQLQYRADDLSLIRC